MDSAFMVLTPPVFSLSRAPRTEGEGGERGERESAGGPLGMVGCSHNCPHPPTAPRQAATHPPVAGLARWPLGTRARHRRQRLGFPSPYVGNALSLLCLRPRLLWKISRQGREGHGGSGATEQTRRIFWQQLFGRGAGDVRVGRSDGEVSSLSWGVDPRKSGKSPVSAGDGCQKPQSSAARARARHSAHLIVPRIGSFAGDRLLRKSPEEGWAGRRCATRTYDRRHRTTAVATLRRRGGSRDGTATGGCHRQPVIQHATTRRVGGRDVGASGMWFILCCRRDRSNGTVGPVETMAVMPFVDPAQTSPTASDGSWLPRWRVCANARRARGECPGRRFVDQAWAAWLMVWVCSSTRQG